VRRGTIEAPLEAGIGQNDGRRCLAELEGTRDVVAVRRAAVTTSASDLPPPAGEASWARRGMIVCRP
jgi:hypothetical protein